MHHSFHYVRFVYTNNVNPVARHRTTWIGLFLIGVARQGFHCPCKYPFSALYVMGENNSSQDLWLSLPSGSRPWGSCSSETWGRETFPAAASGAGVQAFRRVAGAAPEQADRAEGTADAWVAWMGCFERT
jgi:hypothetical protein